MGVLGEVLSLFVPVELLEPDHQVLQIVGVQLGVQLDPLFRFLGVNDLFKALFGQLHDHVGKHLDKAAVGVVGKTGVAGKGGQALHHGVVESQVEDGVHHAGHGGPGAGADRHQQGVGGLAELFAGDLLQLGQVLQDLGLDLGANGAPVVIILGTGLGGDGETLGNGHAQVGHLGQVGALAAQQLPHGAIALRKLIYIFFCHERVLLFHFYSLIASAETIITFIRKIATNLSIFV